MTDSANLLPLKPARRTLRAWLNSNPVIFKELRGRMRGLRTFILLTAHLLLMSAFITLLYSLYGLSSVASMSVTDTQYLGKIVFNGVVGMELLLTCFITPALTAGAISGERERQTLDLLHTTLLSGRALVWGKLGSALAFMLVLLAAGIPLQGLAFVLGGVAPEEFIIANLLLPATAFLFGAAGIFFSAFMRRTLGATVLAYGFAITLLLALPVLLFPFGLIISSFGSGTIFDLWPVQAFTLYAIGLLIITNPIATAITTEILLLPDAGINSAFYFTLPIGNNIALPMLSPWLPCLVFCLGLGMLMIIFAIRRVEHGEG